ncbi:hypothetical protein AB0G02_38775, partial [Actinosynnema sp. NPDC023658]|uniref:hypothetical protein n=1 Tax=Actinosynnema sp. NPDC023658 TaxID=3155465 RepID=UPI0033CF064F
VQDLIRSLAHSRWEALRFLACRAYTAAAAHLADEAVDWLVSDTANLRLGWTDSPRWATHQLIQAATAHCSEERVTALCTKLMDYYPGWETTAPGRGARGRSQHELLTAIPSERLPELSRKHLGELQRKFPDSHPSPPEQLELQVVGSPVPEQAAGHMTDDQWRRAIAKYDHSPGIDDPLEFIGGADELADLLGRQARQEPERFTQLALSFTATTAAVYTVNVIQAVTGRIPIAMLSRLCLHAHRTRPMMRVWPSAAPWLPQPEKPMIRWSGCWSTTRTTRTPSRIPR